MPQPAPRCKKPSAATCSTLQEAPCCNRLHAFNLESVLHIARHCCHPRAHSHGGPSASTGFKS
eukprot:351270-Chlamydomonas_euryale.AAC.15